MPDYTGPGPARQPSPALHNHVYGRPEPWWVTCLTLVLIVAAFTAIGVAAVVSIWSRTCGMGVRC